ncbi:MAG: MFS transporter, partial [Cutibacterium avidum]|nr:MFS transporter [Cutibacterium avidum]
MFWQNLRHLWRRHDFRRILGVRVATQAADGTLQVGMASYVLLSPEQQPDAWSITMVLAITLLPFSIIGPFISVVLDRWSRQRILVYTDGLRCLIAIGLGILVWDGARDRPSHLALLVGLLIAMSLNRFLLTALVAGLEYTIDKRDYLTASSIMPTIGPLGLMIGAVVAAA